MFDPDKLTLVKTLSFTSLLLHSFSVTALIHLPFQSFACGLSTRLIFCTIFLSFLHHSLDLLRRQLSVCVINFDICLCSSNLVFCSYRQESAVIDIECHQNLRLTSSCTLNSRDLELTKKFVAIGYCAFSLKYAYVYFCLPVF